MVQSEEGINAEDISLMNIQIVKPSLSKDEIILCLKVDGKVLVIELNMGASVSIIS